MGTLPRRAWEASIVLDYLLTLPEIDKNRVGIFGYSRDGKQISIAAAIDPRFDAVIAGSTGVGGLLPFRLAGERNQAEGIETTTRSYPDWFIPSLRFFVGHEDRLPVDGNLLLTLLAPRPCLMVSGLNDEVSNTWGDEQSIHSAAAVYTLTGAPHPPNLLRLPGSHGANDLDRDLDWLDIQFGRSDATWVDQFVFPWSFDRWRSRNNATVDFDAYPDHLQTALNESFASVGDREKHKESLRRNIREMLGEEPPFMQSGGRPSAGGPARGRGASTRPTLPTRLASPPDIVNWIIQRSSGGSRSFGWFVDEANETASRSIVFGDGVKGDLYYPKNVTDGTKLPTVIWLHSYSYPLGYMWVYHTDLHPILALVKAGYAVLAYDQCGFGSRMGEATSFYDRYPRWSQMGRMVEDVDHAVDTLQKDPLVDANHIFLVGYSLGGNVALYSAALNEKVAGVVSICGFTPMRTDTAEKGTGGVARYAMDRPLIPRLGLFIGHETKIPFDYDEMIAAIAPRPVMIVEPQWDRDATIGDVNQAVQNAKGIYTLYHASDRLALDEPMDYNRLPTATMDRIIEWMAKQRSQ